MILSPASLLWPSTWTLYFYRSKLLFSAFSYWLTDNHTPKQQPCSSKVKVPTTLSKWATQHEREWKRVLSPASLLWPSSWTLYIYRRKLLFGGFSYWLTVCHTPKQQHGSSKVKCPNFLSKWATFHVCSKRINRVFKPPLRLWWKSWTPQFYPSKLLFGGCSYWLTDYHTPNQ